MVMGVHAETHLWRWTSGTCCIFVTTHPPSVQNENLSSLRRNIFLFFPSPESQLPLSHLSSHFVLKILLPYFILSPIIMQSCTSESGGKCAPCSEYFHGFTLASDSLLWQETAFTEAEHCFLQTNQTPWAKSVILPHRTQELLVYCCSDVLLSLCYFITLVNLK